MESKKLKERDLRIPSAGVDLEGILTVPEDAGGLVVFVHGSGSSRHSPRNQFVARTIQQAGLATLLFDLLTGVEEQIDLRTRHLRFDIPLLARRTIGVLEWLGRQAAESGLKTGLFGASTGAAAALIAAAERPDTVRAVVSRGGRPDLAGPALPRVQAPTLLIVGSHDEVVVDLNEQALARIRSSSKSKLMIVPDASHLFEEPGTLEQAAQLAADWFQAHLTGINVR